MSKIIEQKMLNRFNIGYITCLMSAHTFLELIHIKKYVKNIRKNAFPWITYFLLKLLLFI